MDKTFKPTVPWMKVKYDELNKQLFGGQLDACEFAIFTTGKGSQGRTLGWFKITRRGVKIERSSRRLFYSNPYDYFDKEYVNSKNFVKLCWPRIELNGNYSGTENSFLATLAHEMCHYYNYMFGYAPIQAHGPEFRQIASIVTSRSNGLFTIQRLASSEQMSELELDPELKAKEERKLNKKKSSVYAIISFLKNKEIRLTITSNDNLINMVRNGEEQCGSKVIVTNDSNVIDFLFSKGYKSNMRTWRYWSLEGKPWIDELKGMLPETSAETLGVKRNSPKPEEPDNTIQKQPKKIFSIKTTNGVFEYDATSYGELFYAIKAKFPKMDKETIKKIINNPNNYRIEEEMHRIKKIVEETIKEFIENDVDDSIEISPNMNLGIESPMEEI